MSNNNATDTAEVFDILDTGDKHNNSRGCNAHTVINNTACRLRLKALSTERLTTAPWTSQRPCKHSLKNTAMNRIGTILAYVVACVILAIGFAGFLLVVTDSDATQSSITLWSFLLTKVCGIALVALSVFAWRLMSKYGDAGHKTA